MAKVCGDTQAYNIAGGEGTKTYAVNVIRSLRWPGAVSVASRNVSRNACVPHRHSVPVGGAWGGDLAWVGHCLSRGTPSPVPRCRRSVQ